MRPLRIVDTHQHVFWHGRDHRGLVADMDAHGIDRAWLLTWEIPPFEDRPDYHRILNPIHARVDGTHAGIPLSDVLWTRDRYPERFVAGYCPHPTVGDAPSLLRAAVGIHDIRVCGEWKFRVLFDDPRCLELFRTAGELGLPVVLHLDVPFLKKEGKPTYQASWYGGTVENLERALKACPETIFIGHAPGFWREISGDAEEDPSFYPKGPLVPGGRLHGLFERNSNLRADLSAGSALYALQRDPKHAVNFLRVHADRLLFGRDDYGQDLHNFLKTLPLDAEVIEKVYWRNAEELLGDEGVGTAGSKS